MKLLYKFTYKNKDGKDIRLAIRKPTRFEIDDADMMYNVFLSDCIKKGILTKEMLEKKILNFGGILSERDEKEYAKLYGGLLAAQEKLKKAKGKKEIAALEEESRIYFSALYDIQRDQERIFDRTADVIARNKTVMHLTLLLAMKDSRKIEDYETEEEAEWISIYPGEEYQERYESYAQQEELDETDAVGILSRINFFVNFWYYGSKGLTEKDFQDYDDLTRQDYNELITNR